MNTWEIEVGTEVDVEEVVSLDFEPQVKGRIKVSSFVIDF